MQKGSPALHIEVSLDKLVKVFADNDYIMGDYRFLQYPEGEIKLHVLHQNFLEVVGQLARLQVLVVLHLAWFPFKSIYYFSLHILLIAQCCHHCLGISHSVFKPLSFWPWYSALYHTQVLCFFGRSCYCCRNTTSLGRGAEINGPSRTPDVL